MSRRVNSLLVHEHDKNIKSINPDMVYKELLEHFNNSTIPSMHQVEEFAHALGEEICSTDDIPLLVNSFQAMINEGKLFIGLQNYIGLIYKNCTSTDLILSYQPFFELAVSEFFKKIKADIYDLEIGRCFEIFDELGLIDIESQVLVIRHFNCIGDLVRAENLALRIAQIHPKLPGLQSEIKNILTQKPESLLKEFQCTPCKPIGIKVTQSKFTMVQIKDYKEFLFSIPTADLDVNQYNKHLESINKILGEEFTIFDLSFKELYWKKAVILDALGRHIEALQILYALRFYCSTNLVFHDSFLKTINSLFNEIYNLGFKDPSNPKIEQAVSFLSQIHFVPYYLLTAYANYLIKMNDVNSVKEIIKKLIKLNPNDIDYLNACLTLAKRINDAEYVLELTSKLSMIRRKYPWHLDLVESDKKTPSIATHCSDN